MTAPMCNCRCGCRVVLGKSILLGRCVGCRHGGHQTARRQDEQMERARKGERR